MLLDMSCRNYQPKIKENHKEVCSATRIIWSTRHLVTKLHIRNVENGTMIYYIIYTARFLYPRGKSEQLGPTYFLITSLWHLLMLIPFWGNSKYPILCNFSLKNFDSKMPWVLIHSSSMNQLRPRQNDYHNPDDIFKSIFLNENLWVSIENHLVMYRILLHHGVILILRGISAYFCKQLPPTLCLDTCKIVIREISKESGTSLGLYSELDLPHHG